jgi:hypothetical protein
MGEGQRIDKTGRTIKRRRFSLINHDTMDSPAWKSLSAVARTILFMIYHRHDGSNSGLIHLSVREVAKELNIGKSTAAKGFDELQRCGFTRLAAPICCRSRVIPPLIIPMWALNCLWAFACSCSMALMGLGDTPKHFWDGHGADTGNANGEETERCNSEGPARPAIRQ